MTDDTTDKLIIRLMTRGEKLEQALAERDKTINHLEVALNSRTEECLSRQNAHSMLAKQYENELRRVAELKKRVNAIWDPESNCIFSGIVIPHSEDEKLPTEVIASSELDSWRRRMRDEEGG